MQLETEWRTDISCVRISAENGLLLRRQKQNKVHGLLALTAAPNRPKSVPCGDMATCMVSAPQTWQFASTAPKESAYATGVGGLAIYQHHFIPAQGSSAHSIDRH